MASDLRLASLQRWMQAVVVHAGTAEQAVAAPEAQAELPAEQVGDVILASRSLSPVERVGIYHGMYLLRMVEALESDYPALQHFLGHDAFHDLVRGYVQAFPSRSYTLNRLGDQLPDYVRDVPGLARRAFCYDLARLELAVSQVFDAEEAPPLSAEAVTAVPPEAWERARLRPIPAFRLLAFRYPVNAYLQSVKDDHHDHPRVRSKDTWLAVHRRGYGVWRTDLSRAGHGLLGDLVEGVSLGDAVARALHSGGRRGPRPEELQGWFRDWVAGGVFQSVELEPPA